jgi:hypothetical protein
MMDEYVPRSDAWLRKWREDQRRELAKAKRTKETDQDDSLPAKTKYRVVRSKRNQDEVRTRVDDTCSDIAKSKEARRTHFEYARRAGRKINTAQLQLSEEDFEAYLLQVMQTSDSSERTVQVYRQVASIPAQRAAALLKRDISLGAAIEFNKLPDKYFKHALGWIDDGEIPVTREVAKELNRFVKKVSELPSGKQAAATSAWVDRQHGRGENEPRPLNVKGQMQRIIIAWREGNVQEFDPDEVRQTYNELGQILNDMDD